MVDDDKERELNGKHYCHQESTSQTYLTSPLLKLVVSDMASILRRSKCRSNHYEQKNKTTTTTGTRTVTCISRCHSTN